MAWTDHAAVLEEGIAGRDDLRTSLGQAHVVRRVARLSADVHAKFRAVVDVESRLVRRAGVLLHALLAGIAVAGVALASGGSLSVAQLVTLFLVTSTFVGQIAMVANHLPDLQAGLGAVIRLRQMLAVPPEPEGGSPLPEGPLDLELRGLHFSYAEGTFALQGIDLQVPAGQTVALVGRTGSGKSTLAALVSRAMEPPRGTVFLGGTDVRDLDLQRLRRSVGVVTQRTEILAGTLAENITLFAEIPRSTVEAAVVELGLDGWVAGLPDGLDTLLGPGGTSLSAGEEQLVAFARLLVRDVRVVVLDEATARMDPLTERRVVAAADRLLAARTGILVAHRLSTIERAPLVAVLERGRIVQQGARTELAVAPGPFRDLLEASRTDHGHDLPAGDGIDAKGVVAAELSEADRTGVGGRRRSGPPPEIEERRHGSLPGARHRARARGASGVGRAGSSPVPARLPHRRARGRHRAALGTRRRGPPAWREPHVADRRGRGEPARRARPAGQRLLALPPVVGRGDAPSPDGGALRPDEAAPPRADSAGRGRRTLDGRRPLRQVRRPLGRLRQRPDHRRRHRAARRHLDGRRGAARRDGRLGTRLDAGPADRGPLGGRRRPRPGRGSAAPSSRRWTPRAPSSWRPPSPRSMPTCATWTPAASLPR